MSSLKLHEVINLYYELNGITKQSKDGSGEEVIIQGILKQKMPLKNKIYLQRLNKIISDEVKIYEDTKKELFKKYGTEKDGMISIQGGNIEEFNKEHFEILNAEKKVDVKSLWGNEFNINSLDGIETDEFYPHLFKLIDSE